MGFFENMFGGNSTTADLKQEIENGAFLVDVREPSEFASGSAKNAVNIPLGTIPSKIEEFKGKNAVVVFCRSGNRSAHAKHILEQNGIKNVINGGTWQNVASLQ
jgi:rhodanese-related sulfurtransferase